MKSAIYKFPRQKLPFSKKNKTWRKEHLDWADSQGRLFSETIRKRMYDKKVNIDLYNGKTNKADMKFALNPNGLEDLYIPDSIQHYPIAAPRIDVLVGEEAERRFDWRVTINNPNALTEIEKKKKELVAAKIEDLIAQNYGQQEMEKELSRYSDYINFEWQDIREKRANLLLKHFIKECRVEYKFTEGFRDAMLVGEEAYLTDVRHGNPIFEKLNPLKTYVIQHGYSNRYEDAAVIVIDDYWSPGRFIDTYHDVLGSKDVDYILNSGIVRKSGGRDLDGDRFKEDIDDRDGIQLARNLADNLDMHLDIMDNAYQNFNSRSDYFDSEGNIRVLRVYWRSYKKIKVVKSFDPMTGNEIVNYYDESYIPNEALGEKVTTRWVTQWWQGVKAGEKVYVDMKPRPIQYNKIGNPGYNCPGIVGQIYNVNDQRAVSLMDKAKPFNYIFDGAFHKLMEAYSKWFGPVLEIDKAKMPEGWNFTKTMFFARKAGAIMIDSFKEGNKGQATGKLAGAIGNTSGKLYQPSIADFVQTNIELMEYAKGMMDEIMGVPKQRLGNVEKRETVGGVDTAIRQGNYVTAYLFKHHDEVKRRALMVFLETCKIAMKGNKLKLQYVGDDYTNQIFEIDGDDVMEEDYGLDITSEADNVSLEQNLQQLAHAALQNQMLSFSTIMKIFISSSMVEVQRLIEKDEREMQERQSKQAEEQNQVAMEQAKMAQEQKAAELALKEFEITEKSRIEELKLMVEADDKDIEQAIAREEAELSQKTSLDELKLKMQERLDKLKMHDDKMAMEQKKLNKPTPAAKS